MEFIEPVGRFVSALSAAIAGLGPDALPSLLTISALAAVVATLLTARRTANAVREAAKISEAPMVAVAKVHSEAAIKVAQIQAEAERANGVAADRRRWRSQLVRPALDALAERNERFQQIFALLELESENGSVDQAWRMLDDLVDQRGVFGRLLLVRTPGMSRLEAALDAWRVADGDQLKALRAWIQAIRDRGAPSDIDAAKTASLNAAAAVGKAVAQLIRTVEDFVHAD